MKRKTRTVTKRTYSMKGAIPRFITLCGVGANLTPLSQLKYSEAEKFGQDVEINRIEFAKTTFATKEEVETYLTENAYEDFSVNDTDETWTVLGQDSDKFEDVQPIEYEDGVLYFIGKLKVEENIETPAAEITSAEEFAAKKPDDDESKEDPKEEAGETPAEEDAEEKKEKMEDPSIEDGSPAKAQPDAGKKLKKKAPEVYSEETDTTAKESTSEEVKADFAAEEKEEVVPEIKVEFGDELVAKFDALELLIKDLQEKLLKYEEKEQLTIDETPIVIQNSNAVNSDEIIKEETKNKDEKAEKFSLNRTNDLFGLRG